MTKSVLINCYEGIVFVRCNRNTKRENVIDAARMYFQSKFKKPLTGLNNVEYVLKLGEYLDKHFTFANQAELLNEIDVVDINGNIIK